MLYNSLIIPVPHGKNTSQGGFRHAPGPEHPFGIGKGTGGKLSLVHGHKIVFPCGSFQAGNLSPADIKCHFILAGVPHYQE
jgi:hypothetical protein